MVLVDAHCHLESSDFPSIDEVLFRARAAGLVHAVLIGQFQRPGDFGDALALAKANGDFLTPTMGIHPHDAAAATEADFAKLERICASADVAAVGEAGLDYYYDRSPREVQRAMFRRQCALANALGKPLVVHVRDAQDDCYAILRDEKVGRAMLHCFSGDTDWARRYLDLGYFLSISGVVTYKKSEALQAAVQFAPLERLMVETDSPYLAPVPHRGKKNEPAHLAHTARTVAELKGLDVDLVANACARNAAALFGFSLPG